MEATNLTETTAISLDGRGRHLAAAARDVALIFGGLLALTAVAAGAGALWPTLAGSVAPHPTLRPTFAAIIGILAANLRVLALPFILTVCRCDSGRISRRLGDLLIAAVLGVNALNVGVELGCRQGRLIPYLPHLPLEYLAAASAAGVWVSARRRPPCQQPRPLAIAVPYAAATVILLAAAATIEVLLTPHAR